MSSSRLILVSTLAGFAAAQTGLLGDAEVVRINPIGASYSAVLPELSTTNVRGSVLAHSGFEGEGVEFQISVTGFPDEGGPFSYHLHDAPVPTNGSCSATLAHLDPYVRGEATKCDPTKPETCQVGDLSGKYGDIVGNSLSASFNDAYASLVPGLGSFFGNRSIVFHFANKTRITCANFVLLSSGVPVIPTITDSASNVSATPASNATVVAPSGTALVNATRSATATSTPPAQDGSRPTETDTSAAAAGIWVSTGAILLGVVALLL